MKGFVVMFVVLLVGCTRPPVVTLDDARNQFEQSAAAYRTCMNAIGGDHSCVPEQLIMETDQKAYADAMSSGLSNQSRWLPLRQNPPGQRHFANVCFWHKADIRGTATFCLLLE